MDQERITRPPSTDEVEVEGHGRKAPVQPGTDEEPEVEGHRRRFHATDGPTGSESVGDEAEVEGHRWRGSATGQPASDGGTDAGFSADDRRRGDPAKTDDRGGDVAGHVIKVR